MLPRSAKPIFIVLTLFFFNTAACGPSQLAAQDTMEGTSTSHAKREAVAAIPFDKINRQAQATISEVVNNATIYRRLPITTIHNDPDLHLFAIRYPEVIVNVWQLMGITQMTLERTDTYRLKSNDAAGTISEVELLYGTPNLHIYYCEGIYEGPMFLRRVTGSCVAVLQTHYHLDHAGQPQSTNQLDVFLKIDHLAANIAARTVYPLIGSTADHNFVESMRFVERLYETNKTNGRGVQHMTTRLTNIHPQVRNRFAEIAERAYIKRFEEQNHSQMPPVSQVPQGMQRAPALNAPRQQLDQRQRVQVPASYQYDGKGAGR
jgi:hypothetical protein